MRGWRHETTGVNYLSKSDCWWAQSVCWTRAREKSVFVREQKAIRLTGIR